MTLQSRSRLTALVGATALALALVACGDDSSDEAGSEGPAGLSGTVRIDGSSTVAPLTGVAAERFNEDQPDVQVPVATSGTGGGFEKFCRGETDISNASRAIEEDEASACEEEGVEYSEFTVANDGLTVVVNTENDWVDCITVEELKAIWEPGSTVDSWNDVNSEWPDEELALFGAGTDSGTFDYFTDAINGEEGASRTDYSPTEDDNVTVTGVSGSRGGMGYFGLSYFEENQDQLKALEIDGGDGCVAPSTETVQEGSYSPLGRPLFIYPSAQALERPEVLAFVEYYVENANQLAEEALFVPLNPEQQENLEADLEALKNGDSGGSDSTPAPTSDSSSSEDSNEDEDEASREPDASPTS